MALWLLTLTAPGMTLVGGANAMVVSATDATDAKAIASSEFNSDVDWSNATATELTEINVNTATALTGWVFEIIVFSSTPKVFTLTSTGATQDTLDEIGTALATLINLDADIAGAAYNTTTQVLIVALGGGNDDLGDLTITCTVKPPAVTGSGGQTNSPKNIPGFVASLTHDQTSNDNLEVTFAADTLLVPDVKAAVKTT